MLSKTLLTLSCLFSCLIYSCLISHCLFSTHLASSHIFSSHFTWSRLASSPPFSWCFFSPWLIFSLFLLHLIWPLLFLYVLTSSLSFFGDVIQLLFLFSSCLISFLFHLLSLKFYPRLFSSFFVSSPCFICSQLPCLVSTHHVFSCHFTCSLLSSYPPFSQRFFSSWFIFSFLSHLFSIHSDFSCFTASLLISSGLFCSYMFSHFPFIFLSQSFSEMLSNICSSTHCLFSPHLTVLFLPRLMFSHLVYSSSLLILTSLFSYFLALSFLLSFLTFSCTVLPFALKCL